MVLWWIGAAIAVAGLAQAIRIGVRTGDWAGLIPLVVVAIVLVVSYLLGQVSTGD